MAGGALLITFDRFKKGKGFIERLVTLSDMIVVNSKWSLQVLLCGRAMKKDDYFLSRDCLALD